jgi:hypothetical protein
VRRNRVLGIASGLFIFMLLMPASALAEPEISNLLASDITTANTISSHTGVNYGPITLLTSWYHSDWLYRKKVTIDHTKVAADLTNFPVLINRASDGDLASKAQDDGDDILFTQDDGATKLNHEIEKFDGSTGELIAWVRIPSLSSSNDTEIYMYYGNPACGSQQNPTGVWDSSFKVVQHLKDETASTTEDSTSNNNDGTKKSSNNPAEADAKIGKGQDFSSDHISCGDLEIGNAYTAECWIKADTLTGSGDQDTYGFTIMASSATSGYYPLWLTVRGTEVRLWAYELSADGYRQTTGAGLDTTHYFYIVATATISSTSRVYVNGVEKLSFTNDGEVSWTNIFTLGDLRPDRAIYFDGVIDEVRISNVVRDVNWINTCYNNQSSPSTFCSVESEESPYTVQFEGWGWCPHEQKGVGDVTFSAILTITPRAADPNISDIRFMGTLNLTYPGSSVLTFDLDLSGVKTRSLFYLGQHKVNNVTGNVEWEAAFMGTWLTWETEGQYIDYSGVISIMPGEGSLKTTKPYFFELRTPNVQIPEPQLTTTGNYTENLDYLIKWTARNFDKLLTELTHTNFFDILGDMLDRAVVIIKEVRNGIGPYIP